jgi:hypothetical protein
MIQNRLAHFVSFDFRVGYFKKVMVDSVGMRATGKIFSPTGHEEFMLKQTQPTTILY